MHSKCLSLADSSRAQWPRPTQSDPNHTGLARLCSTVNTWLLVLIYACLLRIKSRREFKNANLDKNNHNTAFKIGIRILIKQEPAEIKPAKFQVLNNRVGQNALQTPHNYQYLECSKASIIQVRLGSPPEARSSSSLSVAPSTFTIAAS